MTQNGPRTKKERAKISTAAEINVEIAKLYRRHANKGLSAAELKSRVGALVSLRAGMSDPIAPPRPEGSLWSTPPTILAVPSGCFLSMEQVAAHARGEDIVDISQCEPFVFEDTPPPSRSVVPFRRQGTPIADELRGLACSSDEEQQLLELLEKLKALAIQHGIDPRLLS